MDISQKIVGLLMGKVLVVDDEPSIRNLLRFTLEVEGFEVDTASGGKEALQKMSQKQPNVVVLDLTMPDMDGGTVLQRMRTAGIRSPVLFLSAYGAEEAQRRYHADAALEKPFDPNELVDEVKRLAH